MEERNKVSIWLGNFKSEDELSNDMEEHFTEDGNKYSDFMEYYEINFVDNQFQEVVFEEKLSKERLKTLSSAESFINKIDDDLSASNSLIAIYNFKYNGSVSESAKTKFIGVYNYKQK